MPDPQFSVIVPVYNGAQTITRAIESVLVQSYPPLELIVVDDGCTDETPEVVARFGDHVRYLRQQNHGVSAARNAGALAARGQWLAFLDADDWYYPNRLRWHAELLRRYPEADFLTGGFDYVRPDGSLIRRSMEGTALGRRLIDVAGTDDTALLWAEEFGELGEEHLGSTFTLSVPRDTFLELGGYPTNYQVCEDLHFLIRLCGRSRCAGVICRSMGAYVVHEQSATRGDPIRAQRQTVAALQDARRAIAKAPVELRASVRRGLREARLNLAYALLRTGRRAAALRATLPLLWEQPVSGTRDVLSVARGLKS